MKKTAARRILFFRSPGNLKQKMNKTGRLRVFFFLLPLVVPWQLGELRAQQTDDPFAAESLKLRTALHYDSALGSPLEALVQLYKKEKREEELIGLYQAHIAKYPDDAGAKAVLVRVLASLERAEADEFIQSAAQQHGDHSHLQYLLSQNLRRKDEERSLVALSRAIDLETGKTRRSQWLGELLERSKTERGRELASAQLKKLLLAEGQAGPTMLSLGQVMHRHEFWELSLAALQKAMALDLNPEQGVEAAILSAKAEDALGKSKPAGKRLDTLLGKLAPDHPRRNEVMTLRVGVIASDKERLALLERSHSAYEAAPNKETNVLDYVEVLLAGGNATEALRVLRAASGTLPESARIEEKTLSLLEKQSSLEAFSDFLSSRLELHPDRPDLRYRLVKSHYAMDNPLAASQDFDLVLASLEGAEKTERILDLARYLRSLKKMKFAVARYDSFLQLLPARLDVIRELCEIHLENGLEDRVKETLQLAAPAGAQPEHLLDLAQFLVDEHFFGPAEKLLKDFIAAQPALPFEPGLALTRVQSELGKREESLALLSILRDQADTPARYKNWLGTAMLAHHRFDSLASFFEAEQNRMGSPDKQLDPIRIEKFLYLCEAGEKRQLTAQVAEAVRQRLQTAGLESESRIKLRRLLVRALERNPESAAEVENGLKSLAKEDPARAGQYRLRQALLYHRLHRPDLVSTVLEGLELEKVDSADLLRESFPMLMDFGDRRLAGSALAVVTKLEPGDLFSWERYLSLLAAEGNEDSFRVALRQLSQGIAQRGKAAQWRASTKESLQRHLLDSYWRSISEIVARGNRLAEALPLLDSVEREARDEELLWVNWSRALIFGALNRENERAAAVGCLKTRLSRKPKAVLSFPDGLETPLQVAVAQLEKGEVHAGAHSPEEANLPLLGQPRISWAFELNQGARLLDMTPDQKGEALLVLDNWGQVSRIDAKSGKLKWKKRFPLPNRPPIQSSSKEKGVSPYAFARRTPELPVAGEVFLLHSENELRAYLCDAGSLAWTSSLPGGPSDLIGESSGVVPQVEITAQGNRFFLFDPLTGLLAGIDAASGKRIWEKNVYPPANPEDRREFLFSMNTGLTADRDKVFVFGRRSAVYAAASGELIWNFSGSEFRVFPLTLREQREDLSEEELVTLEQIKPNPVWIPVDHKANPFHLDHLSSRTESEHDSQVMKFLNYPGTLLAPAAAWSHRRLAEGNTTAARLARNYLWLMDERGARRISLQLPFASKFFPVSGVFLGAAGDHAWILRESSLVHIDANRGIVGEADIRYLGPAPRGVLAGTRVYVRGNGGVAVFNALSGQRISGSNWDPAAVNYLARQFKDVPSHSEEAAAAYLWQGIVKRAAPGYPEQCVRVSDVILQGKYCTVFGDNRIVAVSD